MVAQGRWPVPFSVPMWELDLGHGLAAGPGPAPTREVELGRGPAAGPGRAPRLAEARRAEQPGSAISMALNSRVSERTNVEVLTDRFVVDLITHEGESTPTPLHSIPLHSYATIRVLLYSLHYTTQLNSTLFDTTIL